MSWSFVRRLVHSVMGMLGLVLIMLAGTAVALMAPAPQPAPPAAQPIERLSECVPHDWTCEQGVPGLPCIDIDYGRCW